MQLDKALRSRKSIRKFKSKRPDWRAIIDAIDAARYAPMAGGIYSLKFVFVDDAEKIQKLAKASQQDFVADVSYVIVACSYTKLVKNSYGKRSDRYLRQQAGAGIQNFWLKLVEFGLSTCWVGSFVDNQVKSILDIPEDVNVEALFPIGFAMKKSKPKKKIGLDCILYFNKYKNKKMKPAKRLY